MTQEETSKQNAIYETSLSDEALRQGEILSNVIQIKLDLDTIDKDEVAIEPVLHPYAIIVSQDCDLDWDYQAREGQAKEHKKLPNILFCEVTTAINLAQNILVMDNAKDIKKSKMWSRIQINKDERYHFLQKIDMTQDRLAEGLAELGIDFKRFFTVPADEIYHRMKNGETKRRCKLKSPYLQHFTSRFYYFQSRVALPEEHFSEP